MVLDAIGDIMEVRSFDTEKASEGVAMARFLDDIPEGHIALVAVQDTTGEGGIYHTSLIEKYSIMDTNQGHIKLA